MNGICEACGKERKTLKPHLVAVSEREQITIKSKYMCRACREFNAQEVSAENWILGWSKL